MNWIQGFITGIAVSGSGAKGESCMTSAMAPWEFFIYLLKYGIPAVFACLILVFVMFLVADYLLDKLDKFMK